MKTFRYSTSLNSWIPFSNNFHLFYFFTLKKFLFLFTCCVFFFSCKTSEEASPEVRWEPFDESAAIQEHAGNENLRLRFKLINSKVQNKNSLWAPFEEDLSHFSEQRYQELKPLILERDIPFIQRAIKKGDLSYKDLTLFYLYRIRKFESDNSMNLNAVISVNPHVVEQAEKLDEKNVQGIDDFSVYGMPILIKDNINTRNMPTTAGAIAFTENETGNAFIIEKLLEQKALILGKANLSEWAYYFCENCPLGYSATGGQTLNPYGRMVFETGGSSAGSGVAVAANYAVAAIGTETAGSILSPASKNSVVGLKPTVGLLSRTGIIPISGTLDTPGPMTKSVVDNAILLNALLGKDETDKASVQGNYNYVEEIKDPSLSGMKIGVMKSLLSDSLYSASANKMKEKGAILVEFEAPEVSLDGFLTLLNMDMKHDLPHYISNSGSKNLKQKNIEEIVAFNLQDSRERAPYGQGLFEGILKDSTTLNELDTLKERLQENGREFFEGPMTAHGLDAILSIDNYHAAYAAVAKYPAVTVPMGYISGEPKGLTFIGRPFEEGKLLKIGRAFEQVAGARKTPDNYN